MDPQDHTHFRKTQRARPSSAPLSCNQYVIRKEFQFGSSTLNQLGDDGSVRQHTGSSGGAAADGATPPTAAAHFSHVTSRMPAAYAESTRPSSAMGAPSIHHKPQLHRGNANVQSSFFQPVDAPPPDARVAAVERQKAGDAYSKSILAEKVAERVAMVQIKRDLLQRRIRPRSAQQQPVSSSAAVLGVTGVSSAERTFRVGFDSRTAILDAAKSACLAQAPVSVASSTTTAVKKPLISSGADPACSVSPPPGAASTGYVDEGRLLLQHKKAELMLANVPLVGAGLRALLLASERRVTDVAGGVLVAAQVLAEDIEGQRELQEYHVHGTAAAHGAPQHAQHSTAVYQDHGTDANSVNHTGGESWRIIFAGSIHGHPHHTGGSTPLSPWDFDDTVSGSAVRIRGRPHSAPLARDRERVNSPPRDYLKEQRLNAGAGNESSGRGSSPSAAAKAAAHLVRPTSAKLLRPPSPSGGSSNRLHSVAALSPTPTVVEADRPKVPEWLDPRGLIGVSVDPRYEGGTTREGFGIFGSGLQPRGGLTDGGGGGADGVGHEPRFHGAMGYKNSTALTLIREARLRKEQQQRDQRGVLRGGAGFLMFSKLGGSISQPSAASGQPPPSAVTGVEKKK